MAAAPSTFQKLTTMLRNKHAPQRAMKKPHTTKKLKLNKNQIRVRNQMISSKLKYDILRCKYFISL